MTKDEFTKWVYDEIDEIEAFERSIKLARRNLEEALDSIKRFGVTAGNIKKARLNAKIIQGSLIGAMTSATYIVSAAAIIKGLDNGK